MGRHDSEQPDHTQQSAVREITISADTEPATSPARDRPNGRRALAALGLAGLVGLIALLGIVRTDRDTGEALDPSSDESTDQAAAPGVGGDPDRDSVTAASGSSSPDAGADHAVPDRVALGWPDDAWLAVRRGPAIVAIHAATGEEQPMAIPGRADGDGPLAAIEGRLVYVHGASAWVVDFDGEASVLGPADRVLRAADPNRVWLGIDEPVTATDPEAYIAWTEVDSAGNEFRTARREVDMEFAMPDLVWGFDSNMYRLSERDVHPWRYIAQGFPVAVGHNDLILNICSADRECGRAWFDAQTGENQGDVMADVADNLTKRYGGLLSPHGRFVSHSEELSGGVVRSTASGAILTSACARHDAIVWAPGDELLACETEAGLLIAGPDNARVVLETSVDGFVFLASAD